MGKGSGNKAAVKLQEAQMAQSAAQNKQMLDLMQAQVDNAKTMKLPKAPAPMPLPGSGAVDAVAQSQEMRKSMLQRSGLAATKIVPPPMKSAFGTPMFNSPGIAA